MRVLPRASTRTGRRAPDASTSQRPDARRGQEAHAPEHGPSAVSRQCSHTMSWGLPAARFASGTGDDDAIAGTSRQATSSGSQMRAAPRSANARAAAAFETVNRGRHLEGRPGLARVGDLGEVAAHHARRAGCERSLTPLVGDARHLLEHHDQARHQGRPRVGVGLEQALGADGDLDALPSPGEGARGLGGVVDHDDAGGRDGGDRGRGGRRVHGRGSVRARGASGVRAAGHGAGRRGGIERGYRGRRLPDGARAAHEMDRAPGVDVALAADDDALPRLPVDRARHHRPALGHVGGRVGAGDVADLERVARADRAIEPDHHLLVPALDDDADGQPLVARALPAHELRARTTLEVLDGEAAVERLGQARLEGAGVRWAPRREGVQRLAIAGDDVEHVIGVLHAALDLEGADPGRDERGQMADGQVVARAQQHVAVAGVHAAALGVLQRVAHAARLRAVPAIRRAAAAARGEPARARIADADRAMAEGLDLHARLRELRDLGHRELPAAGDARDAQLVRRQPRARGRVHAGLGGEVDLDRGGLRRQARREARVGDDHRVGAGCDHLARQRDRAVELVIAQVDVEGDVDAGAAGVRGPGAAGQLVEGQVPRAGAGVVGARAAIDRVGAGGDGGQKRLVGPGGREQLWKASVMDLPTPLEFGGVAPAKSVSFSQPRIHEGA